MELTELLNSVNTISVTGEVQRQDVTGIEYDSRNVTNNFVFVAIKGFNTDGHKFINDAINKGAIAVVMQDAKSIPDEIFNHNKIAKILVKNSRIALAEISKGFYNDPSSKLSLIGITGTNGKTTTSYFVKSILETAGYKVGLSGTITNMIGSQEIKSKLTTPEANDMNKLLLNMYEEGCEYAVMEVSSHSLYLNRVFGLNFSAGVFTNITSDHLDFHGTFENYLDAKKKLFSSLKESAFGVYNIDDKHNEALKSASRARTYFYGTSNADFILRNIEYDLNGTRFIIDYNGSSYNVDTTLVGDFNAYNACAAFAVTVLSGVDEDTAVEGIKNTKQVPGRFEVLSKDDKKVIIDYSHTEDSLSKTLKAIRKIVKDERPVYTVFGCGGNRDRSKRPLMGKVASELSDKAYVTSDNPRFENPDFIIKEIVEGIKKNNFESITNREDAIEKAIKETEDNSVILIAGKGHETYQEVEGKRSHFSDKEIAEKYLNE